MSFLALDLGSSFFKSALVDPHTLTLSHRTRRPSPARMARSHPAAFWLDAQAVYETVRALIDEQLAYDRTVEGILFSTQMHGFVLTRNMDTLTPYVTWQDACAEVPRPGGSDLTVLRTRLSDEDVRHMGTRYKAGLAACSLFSYLHEHPLSLEGVQLHTLGSYLCYQLSGGRAFGCHITNAAATGFLDARRSAWNADIQHAVGVETLTFPPIVHETCALGTYRGIPLYPDIGDHQASVYGSGDDLADTILLTIGTGAILCAVTPHYVEADFEVRPFFDGQWLLTLTRQPGGRVLDVLVDLFSEVAGQLCEQAPPRDEIWEVLWQSCPDAPASLHIQPDYFLGQGEGAITQIGPHNLRMAQLFGGTLDGLACAYKQAITRLVALQPGAKRLLLCGGKLSKAQPLHDRLQAATGLSVACSDREDEALYGLGKLARHIVSVP